MMRKEDLVYQGKEYAAVRVNGLLVAGNELAEALFDGNGAYAGPDARLLDEAVGHFTGIPCFDSMGEADLLNALLGEDPAYFGGLFDEWGVRRCLQCGRAVVEGYMYVDGGDAVCSDKCLLEIYRGDAARMELDKSLVDTDSEVLFYTAWDSPYLYED